MPAPRHPNATVSTETPHTAAERPTTQSLSGLFVQCDGGTQIPFRRLHRSRDNGSGMLGCGSARLGPRRHQASSSQALYDCLWEFHLNETAKFRLALWADSFSQFSIKPKFNITVLTRKL